MTPTILLWLALTTAGAQPAPPLALDVRVFRGAVEVTAETTVTVFPTGTRVNGRAAPIVPSGERQLPLTAGKYDLQLVQQTDGKVSGIVDRADATQERIMQLATGPAGVTGPADAA